MTLPHLPSVETLRVGELISTREAIHPGMKVETVVEHYFNERRLDAVALVENGRVYGLALRNKIFGILFRRFGFELYARSPISEIADTVPLVVQSEEALDRTLEKAMRRSASDIYDDVVVVDRDDNYVGLLSVKGMVQAQGDALSQSLMQRELALSRAREMQKVSDLKSEFIAHVTHELRSPANVILGASELLKLAAQENDFDSLEKHLHLLSIGAVNMRAIITNILDLSKIEAGRMEILPGPCSPAELLEEVAEMTRILLAGKSVEVRVVADTATFVTDFVKVRQMLVNLASNAAKFTETGSIELTAVQDDDAMCFSVRDSGIGIAADDLEHLFAPFTQIENAKTRFHQGTGLGLTITRKLADLLGGTITVASRTGQGSTFTIRLPAMPHSLFLEDCSL